MNIALDTMGGDFAPLEAIKGAKIYLDEEDSNAHLTLIGDKEELEKLTREYDLDPSRYTIVHASQRVGMNEHPTKALKEKPQSSIVIGFTLLASSKVDAFIGAGNTGAMLVGSLYSIKAIEGITRPAIGAYMPTEKGELSVLIDVGLNSDCKPENLSQFAILGSLFAEHILNFKNPRVALLNVGEEEGKGNLVCQAAYPILKANPKINFIGNAEGRDVLMNKAEIYVCDGFTGNILLKFAESFYDLIQRRNIDDEYFNQFNFEKFGGVPVLGVNKPVVVGHGISGAMAFSNMIKISEKMIDIDFIGKIKSKFSGN
ncbi:MAG: phosphate acyltransferase PlsX [Ginsengibacter sp.]